VNTVSSNPQTAGTGTTTTSTTSDANATEKQQFMTMLLQQLTHQDPLQPMSGSDMTQQLLGIQQIQSLDTLQTQIAAMNQGNVVNASNVIGKTVSLSDPTGGTNTTTGQVSAIRQSSDGIQVVVNGN
ncbi:unnamed protein product, partial [Phaeothamnion confervicola]